MSTIGKAALTKAQIAMLAVGAVLGLGTAGTMAWQLAKPTTAKATPSAQPTADEQRLAERADEAKVRKLRDAQKLRQQEIGSGYHLDEQGELVPGGQGADDLPQNRFLADATSPEAMIARGIRNAPRERPISDDERLLASTRETQYRDDPPARQEEAPRSELGQSMLGYSTVKEATWANRRPDKNSGKGKGEKAREAERQGEQAEGQGDEQGSNETAMDRMARVMEESTKMAAAATVAGANRGQTNGGSLGGGTGGPSRAGNDLMPAEEGPQGFRAGSIGDMRIGGNVGPDQIVRQGKFLDCVLVNQVRADLVESPVIAMVSRDFVSLDGRYVLVPAGTKLAGMAGRVQNLQQARVYIRFDRALFPDQRSAYFPTRKLPAVDAPGAVGIEGDVDRHFLLTFGSAVMLGMLDGLAAAVEGASANATPTLRELMIGRTSMNMSQVVSGILQRYGNVVPTVTVEPGAKMKVVLADDVRMSPYMRTADLVWVRGER